MLRPAHFFLPALLLLAGCSAGQTPAETPNSSGSPSATNDSAASPEEDGASRAPTPKAADPIAPGSRLSLWLPDQVERLGRALVFKNSNSNLVVALAELTATEGEGPKLIDGIVGGAQGLEVQSDETKGGLRKVLLSGEKTDRNARMLILEQGGKAATIYVIFNPAYASQAEKILASASLNSKAPLDPLAIHGLELGALGSMQVGDSAHQPIVLTRRDQKTPIPSTSAVAFISVNPHNYGADITDEELGGLLGANLAHLNPDFEKTKTNAVQIAGEEAHELLLQGEKDGTPLAIYAYALRDGDCAIIAVSYVQMDRADDEMADVVPLLRSLKRSPL